MKQAGSVSNMVNRIHQAHTGKRSVIREIFSAVLILLAVSLACSAVAETKTENINAGLGTGVRLLKKPNDSAIRGSYQGTDVKVQILGVCRSYIFIRSSPMIVNTSDLSFATDVAPEETLACVVSTTPAKVYWGPEFKAAFSRCKPGTILAVVAVGDDYIEVKYPEEKNAFRGFLKKASVQLCEPAEGIGTGLVKNGKQSVNMRAKMDIKSAKVETIKSGTEIIVVSDTGNWYEVEYNGLHGYIRKEFITLLEKGFGDEAVPADEDASDDKAVSDDETVSDDEDVSDDQTVSDDEAVSEKEAES